MGNSPTPPGLIERIMIKVDERIAAFARSGFLRNATISEGGLTIKGGFLRVLFPKSLGSGLGVFFGDIVSAVTGLYMGTGLLIQDADGTDIASFRTDVASGTTLVGIWDSQQNAVFYTDTVSGEGLGRPYVPGVFYRSRNTDWVGTGSGSFETLFRARVNKQHPKLFVRAWAYNDTAGATGEVRVMVNGVELEATHTTNSSSIAEKTWFGPAAGAHMAPLTIEVQARLTAGAGLVRVEPSSLDGRP